MPDSVPAVGTPLPMELPGSMNKKRMELSAQKLIEAYEELRKFAFEEKLTPQQTAVLNSYKDMFAKVTYPSHYPYYHALSPAFFHWLKMPLPDGSTHVASKAEKVETPKVEAEPEPDQNRLLILENLRGLVKMFSDKIATDKHKDHMFDEMHKELQNYKNGLIESITQSMERDVIHVIENTVRSAEVYGYKEPTPENYMRLLSMFQGVESDLTDLLYRQGTEPFTEDYYDVQRQRIISTEETDDPALDKRVMSHFSNGWEKNGRVIRHERVGVYVYNPHKHKVIEDAPQTSEAEQPRQPDAAHEETEE
jgi:molecular chaperone GrpE (heat shock protein)